MSHRVKLKRSWKNKQGRTYPVGTIIQCDNILGSELISGGFGDKYDGEYPPKKKEKIELNNLNTK